MSTRPATPSVGDNIVATLQGKGSKNFLLMIHYDTVFAEGSAAERPFRMDGQRAYGPGVADAKGGVAMILHALKRCATSSSTTTARSPCCSIRTRRWARRRSKALIAELARKHDYVFSTNRRIATR